jgi:A/G-specific adenine glycosylase
MVQYLQRQLLRWFDEHARAFPWRDPAATKYEQILSEILLQRTRAETVARFYPVFFARYPDWKALSRAKLEDLEEILRPLGLYRHRARRLYRLARDLKRRRGRVPCTSDELSASGFAGLYVTNAFELFVLRHRRPLLDVNMSRVLKRYFNSGVFIDVRHDRALQLLATDIIEVRRCKELNWAILDFAALVCRSRVPRCHACVLALHCLHIRATDDE